jgi:hypothetical protein
MDDLPEPERARVAAHLEACAGCRRVVVESRALLAGLAAGPPAPPPIEADRYRAELQARRAADGRSRWTRGWPGVAAAAVATVGLLLALQARDGGREPAGLDDAALAARLPLLRQYPVVERLDLLEDLDAIRHLDRVAGAP